MRMKLFRADCRLLIVAAMFAVSGCQLIAARALLPKDARPPEYKVHVERGVSLSVSNGVTLVSDIYTPETPEPTPTILLRVPFSRTFKNDLAAEVIGTFWASRGYIVVIQGTRGRFKSNGSHYPLIHERQDGLATLHWLAQQSWFDGRLGMWGGSAFGYTQ
jgi:uncharacterized protein